MAKTTSPLGARLRALREERGLDIGTVAYRTGLDYNYIYRLERGDRRNPSYEVIRKLGQALGVAPEELVAGVAAVDAPVYPERVELNRRLDRLPAALQRQVAKTLSELIGLFVGQSAGQSPAVRLVLSLEGQLSEAEALLAACGRKQTWKQRRDAPDDLPTGERDRAIILMLIDTGVRASELCGLKRDDLNMAASSARILGKGQKERVIQIGKRATKALWPLLTNVPQGEGAEYVFTVGPVTDARPMSRYVLLRQIKRIGERAGVAHVYPHRFRHTFAITYLRNGGDLFTLQELLGHSDLAMVRRYARIAQIDCARAHAKASPVDNWKL